MVLKTPTFALVITGAVCSGKTSLAQKLGEVFGIPVHSEGPGKHYHEIEGEIDSLRFPVAIFEHCSIQGAWRKLREQYDRVLIVVLNVEARLLNAHFAERLRKSVTGEFRKIDPLQQQEEILEDCQWMVEQPDGDKFRCIIHKVETAADYERVQGDIESELIRLGIEAKEQRNEVSG